MNDNKRLEIYDLICRLYHKEDMPYKIRFETKIYTYDKDNQDYKCEEVYYTDLFCGLFSNRVDFLHEEIEIIDWYEEKEIIKWGETVLDEVRTKKLSIQQLQKYIEIIMETQNQIIDKLGEKDA